MIRVRPEGNSQMKVFFEDFCELCRVQRHEAEGGWDPLLAIRKDGVHLIHPSTRDLELTPELKMLLDDTMPVAPGEPILRFPCSIDELFGFLEQAGLWGCIDPKDLHVWENERRPVEIESAPVLSKSLEQEKEILREMGKQGIDPLQMKSPRGNQPGSKGLVKKVLLRKHNLFTEASFKKAWERLLSEGTIKYS